MKDKFLNFIRKHNYITLLIISVLVLSVLPGNFVLNVASVSLILLVISLITFIVSKTKKHSASRFNLKKIILGILVIFVAALFVDVAKSGPEAKSHSSDTTTSQVKKASNNSKKAKKANELSKKKSLKKSKTENKARNESASSKSASIASSESVSESIVSSMSESSIAASVASSQSVSTSISSSSSHAAAVSSADTTTSTGDDLYTSTSGKIIGNSKSHIYHVPGQAGYHMNSSNAVYFNTEADAQAAGYRKSLR